MWSTRVRNDWHPWEDSPAAKLDITGRENRTSKRRSGTKVAKLKEKIMTREFQTRSSSKVAVVLVAMVSTLIWPVITQSKSLRGSEMSIPSTTSKVNSLVDDNDQDDRGRIAFASFRGGNTDIFVMRPDGTHLVNVTNNPASDRLPAWSPDGSKIAFRSTRDGNQEIYVMNDDGSNVVRLTFNRAVDTSPSWTPDGRVLFSSNRSGRFEIYEVDANGSDLRHIDIAVDGNLTFPSESREGNRLAFTVSNFLNAARSGSHIRMAHTQPS
jgi:dipeptidyl aminopeptidase/acylaminoacyl peptidase